MSSENQNRPVSKVPNALSIARIVLSLLLPFLPPMETAFLVVFIVAAGTDALDGKIAKQRNCCTELGAKLDTLGDAVFFVCYAVALIPFFGLDLPQWILLVIVLVATLAHFALCYKTSGTFESFHTKENRIVGVLLVILPFLYLIVGRIAIDMCLSIAMVMRAIAIYETVSASKSS